MESNDKNRSSSSTTPSVVSSNKVLPQTGMANTNSIVYSGIAVMMLALGLFMYMLRKRKAA